MKNFMVVKKTTVVDLDNANNPDEIEYYVEKDYGEKTIIFKEKEILIDFLLSFFN